MPRRSNAAIAAVQHEEVPEYRLLAPAFLEDETLHDAGKIIKYWGCPNEHMEALNAPAEARLREYLEELEDGAREVARQNGRTFRGRSRDLGDQVAEAVGSRPREPSRIVMPKHNDDIPVRPDMVPISRRRRADAGKVVSVKAAPKKNRPDTPVAIQGSHYTADSASEAGL